MGQCKEMDKKKKICYIVTIPMTIRAFFIPQLLMLAQKFEVTVICSKDVCLQKELGKKIRYIPVEIPRGISFWGTVKAIDFLRKIFKEEKFDLVQYSTPNAAFCAAIAAKVVGIKIRNYHLMGLKYEGSNGLKRNILKLLEKVSCRLSTNIECVSKSLMQIAVEEKIFPPQKAIVVWNGSTGGVNLERFDINQKKKWRNSLRKRYQVKDDEIVFGFVGRITKDKGINELLVSFKKLSKKKNNVKLILIGGFEEKENLEQGSLQWAMHSDYVRIISQVEDIEKYYTMFDILVLPSYREGFGNVVIEAQAMGVPVIVSNIPGPIDAMEKGKTGLIVSSKSVDALLHGMERMIDEDLIENYSVNTRKYVAERFDSRVLCEKIVERKKMLLGVR